MNYHEFENDPNGPDELRELEREEQAFERQESDWFNQITLRDEWDE